MDESKLLRIKKIIQKKLLGKSLTYEEFYLIVDAIAKKELDNILLTYFAASSYSQTYTLRELYYLTKAMVETGIRFKFPPPVADKHSTGGLPGNRVTLILVPLVASLGITIPKTSSRAITSPAGTADCMEVLAPVELSKEQIEQTIKKTNACIIWGGHLNIAPTDDELIKVEKPLQFEPMDKVIVSIMAKKIAMSSTHLILDMPYNSNLKIRSKHQALKIADRFKKLAKLFNIKIKIIISHPNQPLGKGVGPALEAVDALKVLEQKEDRPKKLENKTLEFTAELLKLIHQLPFEKAKHIAKDHLISKKALKKFKDIIKAQGGDPNINSFILEKKIQKNTILENITAQNFGKIKKVNLSNLSALAKILGAPKHKWSGIKLKKNINETVNKGEILYQFYAKSKHNLQEAIETLKTFPIYEIK